MDAELQCDQCPPCLIPEFTSECTNDCLVLACDDPAHLCLSTTPCCFTAPTCNDCPSLDDIFHCCTDFHAWDPCDDCTQDLHSLYSIVSEPSTSASPSPSFSPRPSLYAATTTTTSFNCMWANCNAAFTTLSALVGHVNLQHLCPIDPQPPLQSQDILSQPPLSCHWGDCAMSSIPSSSTACSDDHILNVLATHLMQDHLGVNYPSLEPDPHISSDAIQAPPNPLLHDCSATHPCKWKACTQSFPSCDDLTAHIASVHIGSGKAHYECFWDDCNRHGTNGFSSKQKISRHLQSHTGHRPFQCQVCNQCFSEAATLQQHMRRHTQEKPYVCDFPGCGKAFAITGALTIHKRTHNGLRPFKCKYCDRAFSESSNLTKHLRTHTGARPYPCAVQGCEKAFARPDQLARHMNVHRKKNG